MKIAPKFFALMLLFVVGFACNSADKGEKIEATDATEEVAEATAAATDYDVNTATSMISWKGYKTFDIGDEHTGMLKLTDGTLSVEDGNIVAGSFTIDMNSIENEDLKGTEGEAKLVGHLKSDDFFAVEEFPEAKFEITSVEAVSGNANATHNITGNLTMRDQTKQISFPANVSVSGDQLTATVSEFTIDRTQWNVMYGNEGIVDLAKDKVISNDLTLKIVLNAES
jgi:polyisoprenoid-binding protein YceI